MLRYLPSLILGALLLTVVIFHGPSSEQYLAQTLPNPILQPLQTDTDFRELDGKYYARVKKGQTGWAACGALGQKAQLNGTCTSNTTNFDLQNPGGICAAFHPTAQQFNTETELLSSPADQYGSSGFGYCDQGGSISCDAYGAAKTSSQSSPLQNTCQVCPSCAPASCESKPESLGLDELFVECSFEHQDLCTANPVAGTLDLELTTVLRERKQAGMDISFPQPVLVENLSGFCKCQGAPILRLNGQDVDGGGFIRHQQNAGPVFYDFTNNPEGGVWADEVVGFPGLLISYIEETTTKKTFPFPVSLKNQDQIKDLGKLSEILTTLKADFSSGLDNPDQKLLPKRSVSISSSIPQLLFSLNEIDSANVISKDFETDHLKACKDVDQDEQCDTNECSNQTPPPAAPNARAVPVSFQVAPQISITPLLQANEVLQLQNDCASCSLQVTPSLATLQPQTPSLLHVVLTQSSTGALSHTILIVGTSNQFTGLYDKNRNKYPSSLIPSVLSGSSNDYFTLIAQADGSTSLKALETMVLKPHLSQPLQNSLPVPHLFFAQQDGQFLLLIKDARYWNLSTLRSSQNSPSPISSLFQGLGSSPSRSECEAALRSGAQQTQYLGSTNTFQVLLDLLTLCQR